MKAFKPVLSGKGLLAASVAMLSGAALAETAGRVSFVTGDVTASTADGSTRTLRRGDVINGGDKISTRAGRLQIRFTDGGFVSLQPNTIFGVDEYLYTNRKPEESSLFFSLLQGGMRTITGTIGKVNKQSYKVRTPVATIGIRGTGYRARVTDKGLLVSVGSGFVNVSTRAGDITAGAGQNIRALDENSTPRLTDETADVTASGVNGDQEDLAEENSHDSHDGDTVAITDLQDENGYTGIQVKDGQGNTYDLNTHGANPLPSHGTPAAGTLGYVASSYPFSTAGLTVTHDAQGLLSISGGEGAGFERGTLKVVNKGSSGTAQWGEFTDGISGTNQIFSGSGSPMELGPNSFLPWITAAPLSVGHDKGSATYAYAGGTARGSAGQGTINQFNITYYFSASLADVLLKVTTPSSSGNVAYQASGTGVSAYAQNGSFNLSGLTTTASGGNGQACSSNNGGCSTSISAFFSGAANAQIAAAYKISDGSGPGAYGVAALNQTGYTPPAPATTFSNQLLGAPSRASSQLSTQSGLTTLFDNTGLLSVQNGGGTTLFERGSLQIANAGSSDNLRWGEFTNGSSTTNTLFSGEGQLVLNSNQFQPWITGAPLSTGYNIGSATYSLQNGPSDGVARNDYGMGHLNSFNLTYHFSTNLVDLAMEASVYNSQYESVTYVASGNGLSTSLSTDGTFQLSGVSTSASTGTGLCLSGCSTDINAFFSGSANAQIGASYRINDSSGPGAYGIAALGQDGYTPPNTAITLQDSVLDEQNPLYYYSPAYSLLGVSCYEGICNSSAINIGMGASFDQGEGSARGGLISVGQAVDEGSVYESPRFDIGTLKTVSIGTQDALSWGEFTDGSTNNAEIFDIYSPLTLGQGDYLPYIIGLSPTELPVTGAATYSYIPGSGSGRNAQGDLASVSQFDITFNFDLATIDLFLALSVGGSSYTVTSNGPHGSMYVGGSSPYSTVFEMDSSVLSVNGSGICSSGTCTASIRGFLAGATGSQMGAYYGIDSGNEDMLVRGVAGLTSTGLNQPASQLSDGKGYSVAFSFFDGSTIAGGNDWSGSGYSDESQNQTFDANGGLTQSTWNTGEGVVTTLDLGSATVDQSSLGRSQPSAIAAAPLLDWGRWYAGPSGASITADAESRTLDDDTYLHYITGVMTSAAVFQAGTFAGTEATYNYVGGTTATGSDGNTSNSVNGWLKVNFGSDYSQLSLDLNIAMSDSTGYNLTNTGEGINFSGPSFVASGSSLSVTGSGASCTGPGTCSGNISGFFAGQQAQQIGLAYHIQDDGVTNRTVDGVAAFERGGFTPTQPVGVGL